METDFDFDLGIDEPEYILIERKKIEMDMNKIDLYRNIKNVGFIFLNILYEIILKLNEDIRILDNL